MEITQHPDLSSWVPTPYWRYTEAGRYIETVYPSPHGNVDCYTEEGNQGEHPGTRLRMVLGGIGWEYTEQACYEPARLLRVAAAFANVAFEAAGAQQQFVNDGAGLVTMAINFARELSPEGAPAPHVSDNLGGAFVNQLPSAAKLAAFGYEEHD